MILNYLITFGAAVVFGKLVSKLKLPAILGWLLAGMVFGPYALNLLNDAILSEPVYEYAINILECSVGLMIGTEPGVEENKGGGQTDHRDDPHAVAGHLLLCEPGVRDCFLFYGNACVSGVYFRRHRACDSSGSGAFDRSGVSYHGTCDQDPDPDGGA